MANSGLEIEIYKDNAPTSKIGVIEARMEPTALREIRANGAGSFQVRKDNRKVAEDPTLLEYRNFCRLRANGQVVGGFILTNKKHVIVGEGEKQAEVWSLSGEGFRSWGRDATVRPYKGISQYSRETRYFNFASEQGAWYDPSQWTNATVTWGWNQAGNWWGTAPTEWPDAPTAQWIWDRGNSSYPMPNGTVYFRKEFTLAEAGQYALFFAVDDAAEVYMDGELIYTTAEHAWQETAREDMDLGAGPHVLAFKAIQNVTDSPGSVIAAFYKIGNASSPTAAQQIFVSDTSWVVSGYPAVEPGWTIGMILNQLMGEASARGIRFAQNWSRTFSNTNDSAGVPWGDTVSIGFDIGTTYEDVFSDLESLGCDIYIDPDTLQMHAYKKRGVDRSAEGTEPNPIILRVGHNLRTADESGQAEIVNTLILKTADGWTIEQDAASVTKYGVVEGQVATELTAAQAESLVEEILTTKSTPEKTATFELIPVPGMVPFENFFEGDWVSAPGEIPGVLEKRRIVSISVAENQTNGNPIYAIEFDAIFSDRSADLEKLISRQTRSSALTGSFSGTTGTPSTVTQGSNPQTPVSAPPQLPTGLVVSTVGRWADNGSAVSDYGLVWDAVISNTNNLPVTDIEMYQVWGRRNPDTEFQFMVEVFDTFAYLKDFNPGDSWSFRVRANSRTGGFGGFSTIQTLTADAPVVPMGVPSTPTLITELGSVVIKWDGLIGGQPAPNRFKFMKVMRATSVGGTYTMVTSFTEGSVVDSSGIVGTAYWYKLVPVDYLGVEGASSASATITVAGVSTAELDAAVNAAITDAVDTANNAITAANGKNKITFSNAAPTTGNSGIAGDMWYRRDGSGKIIGVWENTGGTTWVQRTLTGQNLSDIDAGTLTTGYVGADRIAANSISSEKVLIANLDNQLDNPYFETNDFTGWIRTGSLVGWDIATSSAAEINRYLRRVTTTATGPGQMTNVFKVNTRKGTRLRIDGLSYNENIAPSAWAEARRNFWIDPRARTAANYVSAALGSYSLRNDMTGSILGTATAVRWTREATGTTGTIRLQLGTTMPAAAQSIRFRARVRASESMTVAIYSRPNVANNTSQATLTSSLVLPVGVSEINVAANSFNVATTATSGIVIVITNGAVASTLDLTDISIELNATSGAAFNGALSDPDDLSRYEWVGDPDNSASVYQTRSAGSTIGVQFYTGAGAALSYVPLGLTSSGTWIPISHEVDVPDTAYMASLRVVDAGATNTTLRLANLQFRLMGAGQLLVDGIIQGRHVAANTIEGESMKIGSIAVDRLEPNAGSSLDLASNGSINILAGQVASQGALITQQQAELDENTTQTQAAQDAANAAAQTANSAATVANGLQAGIEQTASDLAAMGTTYRFTPTGAYIGSPDSPYEVVIQNNGVEIRQNGVATTSWDSGRMIVSTMVVSEIVLGYHKLETESNYTVIRRL